MTRRVEVTVAICTHNRAADVGVCLAALAPQLPAHWEALIVDSGSDGGNRAELERLAQRWGVQYRRVDEPGLSLARNVAARAAQREWIAYLDDDAIPAADWAAALEAELAAAPDDAAVIGGRILPGWPPGADGARIGRRWRSLLSVIERETPGSVDEGCSIFGANFCVRIAPLLAIGGFPDGLGRIGDRLLGGEESYVIWRLAQAGRRGLYRPSFSVVHQISSERLSRAWVQRRAYWEGVTQFHLARACGGAAGHLNPVKLVLSLPVLAILSLQPNSRGGDYRIRLATALGSLSCRLGSLRGAGGAKLPKMAAIGPAAP